MTPQTDGQELITIWIDDEPEEKKAVSEKQLRANRENAKKSTGPSSPDGKARSSQNARKHNVFTATVEPVRDGTFVEDGDEFADRVSAVVDSLRPRDAIEHEVATQIAGVTIKQWRLDRWSAATIDSASIMTVRDYETALRDHSTIEYLEGIARSHFYYLAKLHSTPMFEDYARLIRFHGPNPSIGVKGLWTEGTTPSTDDEWRRAYLTLKAYHWDSESAALLWAQRLTDLFMHKLGQLTDYRTRTSAERIMAGPFDRQILYSTRLANTLRTLMREYERLQSRDLGV